RFKRTVGYVKRQLTNADVTWEPWDCSRLLKKVREEPEQRIPVEVTRHFTTPNGDVVCLAGLPEFFAFLKGTDGQLRTGVLEPNVRDYQGKRNLVNKDIRETLDFSPVKEFWWLNNGITILAEDCPINGNKVTLVRPEVVNGLQTSHEIFNFFKEHPERLDGETRSIIMRVIRPPDEQTSSKITKATNFQTEVKGLSLHASEKIHFDIEDKLLFSNLYYDRKKGKYKRLKKPISQIVSVIGLARSVIAILLRRPNDARARPQTLLTDDDTYLQIFSREFDVDLYLACITIDRRVESFLEGYPSSRIQDEEKRDIRYYLDMWLACEVTSSSAPSPSDLAQKVESCKALPDATIERACKRVLKRYRKLGGTEQIAKGPELSRSLQKSLSWLFRKS
ncbi:MAG: AIPR family protein, partial [Bryobacteraceae bacterium]